MDLLPGEPDFLVRVKQRARGGLIAQDLLSLGLRAAEVTALPQCFPMAPFTSPLEALGWMYVVERATLIHDRVRLHICAELPEAVSACNYLSAYEGVAAARWSELEQVLDGTVRNRQMESTVLAAAHAGFRCLAEWQRADVACARVRVLTADDIATDDPADLGAILGGALIAP